MSALRTAKMMLELVEKLVYFGRYTAYSKHVCWLLRFYLVGWYFPNNSGAFFFQLFLSLTSPLFSLPVTFELYSIPVGTKVYSIASVGMRVRRVREYYSGRKWP